MGGLFGRGGKPGEVQLSLVATPHLHCSTLLSTSCAPHISSACPPHHPIAFEHVLPRHCAQYHTNPSELTNRNGRCQRNLCGWWTRCRWVIMNNVQERVSSQTIASGTSGSHALRVGAQEQVLPCSMEVVEEVREPFVWQHAPHLHLATRSPVQCVQ